ncbi:DUF1697 domain-containing protein [Phormidesmis sp. 146-33]
MEPHIVLFRGINVGGNNALPMLELVAVLEELGLSNIKTYIQSGNAVFQSKKINSEELSQKISTVIEKHCGFVAQVLILDVNELGNAIASNPFPEAEAEPNTLHCFFLLSLPEKPNLKALETVKKDSEQFKLIDKVFYLHAPEGIGQSKLAMKVEKTVGVAVTARNWRTVLKIMELVE